MTDLNKQFEVVLKNFKARLTPKELKKLEEMYLDVSFYHFFKAGFDWGNGESDLVIIG